MKDEPALQLSPVSGKYLKAEEPYGVDLASAEAEIRHVFGDTPITEASIGAAPPDILVKLSVQDELQFPPSWLQNFSST